MQKQYLAADHIEVVSYLATEALNRVINASRVVVCRSGYSSIMDLAALRKKALLIPTPGQPEQEYLAETMQLRGIFPFQAQNEVQLERGIKSLSDYSGPDALATIGNRFHERLDAWLRFGSKT
jgi:UDP-N-acetylglucosamine:LPS N-acetylglucosamine transferase